MALPDNTEDNSTPTWERYNISELMQALEKARGDDLLDISLAAARMLTTGPERYSLDDVLARFGYTREQVGQIDDHDVPDGDESSL